MKRFAKDILIVITIFLAGFLTAYYFYALQDWQCSAATITGNDIKLTPLLDKNFASALIFEIDNAEQSIDMAMFEFKFYETEKNKAHQILDSLINASARGVKIRILLDASDWNDEIGKDNNVTINFLKSQGIEAKLDNPKRTLHSKLIIIDNKVFVGSHNLVFSALERNNEASILVENPEILEQYRNYFEWLWNS